MATYHGYDPKVPMYNTPRGFRRGVMQVDVQMATDIKGDKICGYGEHLNGRTKTNYSEPKLSICGRE